VSKIFATFRNDGWTYVIVTALTLLVWFWAASETREEAVLYPTIRFVAAESSGQEWIVTPDDLTVTLRVEGSKRAIQSVSGAISRRLTIAIPPPGASGTVDVTLAQALAQQPELRQTGVSVISVDPGFVELGVDEIVEEKALVRPVLPDVLTEGEIIVEPREVTVRLPRRLRPATDEGLVIDAVVEESGIETLQPGPHTLREVTLRPPDFLRNEEGVSMQPATVKISFVVRSRIRQIPLDDVRVQISGDPQSLSEYIVEIDDEDRVLRDVMVTAESDLARLIETGSAKVAAIVHLTTRDLEEGITSKRVSHFRALVSDSGRPDRGAFVQAAVNGEEAPVIQLSITRRDGP
jgi:hypothetical protein